MNLVFIGRSDAAPCGADGLTPRSRLGGQFDHAVVGQDDLGTVAHKELAVDGQPGFLELFDLAQKRRRVQHDAIADDALASGTQDAAGDQLQDKFAALDDDRVPGVVSAGIAGDDVELLAEDIDDLAFAFIAPLGSKDDGRGLHGGLAAACVCQKRSGSCGKECAGENHPRPCLILYCAPGPPAVWGTKLRRVLRATVRLR